MLALVSTCVTLAAAIILSALSVEYLSLFGLGNEYSVFLKLDPSLSLDPKELLLADIVIDALGITG